MSEREWVEAVDHHLRDYSHSNFERRFLELLGELSRDATQAVSGIVGSVP